MRRTIPAAVAALFAALPAMAAMKGEVGLYYDVAAESDLLGEITTDADGFGVLGAFDFGGPTAHFEYRSVKGEADQDSSIEGEVKTLRIGGGYRAALNEQFGLAGRLEYLDIEDDYASGGLVIDSDGFGLHVAGDYTPIPQLRLGASLGYLKLGGESDQAPGVNLDSDGIEYSLSVAYLINKMFSTSLAYRQYLGKLDDCGGCGGDGETYEFTGLMLGGAYHFGN